jgi:DNA end-binding protein Ku
MALRANWKGLLKVDQLLMPVGLYTAVSTSERVSFHLINRKTGNRLSREFVDSDTGKPVPREEQMKGYEVSSGKYVSFNDEEIQSAIPESNKTLNITHFVKCSEIDDAYLDRPYYLTPTDDDEVFLLLRDGMKAENVAAVAEAVLFRRARKILIRADGDGMIASTLNFDYEVRPVKEAFEDLEAFKFDQEMLDLAKHIIGTKMGRFDLIKAKIEGKPLRKPEAPKSADVIDLKEALRKSAALSSPKKQSAKSGTTKAKPRKAG